MQDTEYATPITVLGVWGWKMQPLLLFWGPGAGKCNPYCCFIPTENESEMGWGMGGMGAENET